MTGSGRDDSSGGAISRRRFAGLAAAGMAIAGRASAEAAGGRIGSVEAVSGKAHAKLKAIRTLIAAGEILEGDLVWTEAQSRTSLDLAGGSHIHLGAETQLRIDRFVAESGGDLVLGDGAIVFDRDEHLPKTKIAVRSVFGLIAVRGTRFFAGPSRGVFAVFCDRGRVEVMNQGARRLLMPGQGVDIRGTDEKPGGVQDWGHGRVDEAMSSVMKM